MLWSRLMLTHLLILTDIIQLTYSLIILLEFWHVWRTRTYLIRPPKCDWRKYYNSSFLPKGIWPISIIDMISKHTHDMNLEFIYTASPLDSYLISSFIRTGDLYWTWSDIDIRMDYENERNHIKNITSYTNKILFLVFFCVLYSMNVESATWKLKVFLTFRPKKTWKF